MECAPGSGSPGRCGGHRDADREHAAPAVAALERGYDVVLEKPIAPTEADVRAVAAAAERSAGSVTVAHVLRYTAFFTTLKRALDAGEIGELVTITHAERIGYWHFAHSFVRGNWRREDRSSPMILAKACHDLDLLRWLAGDRCTSVASFGGLRHFRPEAAPDGALQRCWDGERRCPAAPACPFDAVRLYVERTADVTGWPVSVITSDPSAEGRLEALAAGPYGRCVYASDNDVADHQVTALEFANGVRATLTVSGLTPDNTRTIVLGGTRGELSGRLDTGRIDLRRFLPGTAGAPGAWDRDEAGRHAMRADERRVIDAAAAALDGHGGGDDAMLHDVVDRLIRRRDGSPETAPATGLADAIESHEMAFAAERSRRERRLVELGDR
jgi:predicted dehydrogenase